MKQIAYLGLCVAAAGTAGASPKLCGRLRLLGLDMIAKMSYHSGVREENRIIFDRLGPPTNFPHQTLERPQAVLL